MPLTPIIMSIVITLLLLVFGIPAAITIAGGPYSYWVMVGYGFAGAAVISVAGVGLTRLINRLSER